MTFTLTPHDHRAIAEHVVEMLKGTQTGTAATVATDEILTRPEAREYVKRFSDRAFSRWCKKWSVTSAQHGRYSRTRLDLALQKEARARR